MSEEPTALRHGSGARGDNARGVEKAGCNKVIRGLSRSMLREGSAEMRAPHRRGAHAVRRPAAVVPSCVGVQRVPDWPRRVGFVASRGQSRGLTLHVVPAFRPRERCRVQESHRGACNQSNQLHSSRPQARAACAACLETPSCSHRVAACVSPCCPSYPLRRVPPRSPQSRPPQVLR